MNSQIQRSQIISSYIYNFANNISWPDDGQESFNIVLISSNKEIINELTNLSIKRKIHDKNIILKVLDAPGNDILDAQLIFITFDKISYYMNVFDIIEGKEILLVSEDFDNKSYVMLNLFDADDNTIKFEINKPNILNQNLEISDEILLMGGTKIDVAEIYLKSQHTLREMELKMANFSVKLDSLQTKINESNFQVDSQKKLIDKQVFLIDSQKVFHKKMLNKINEERIFISKQSQLINIQKYNLKILKDSLLSNKNILLEQKLKIINSKSVLDQKISEIDSINKEIKNRNLLLFDKDSLIKKQRQILYLFGIIIFIVFLFVVFSVFWIRQIRKKNQKLSEQRQEIYQINSKLLENNEELQTTLDEIKQMQQQLVQSEKMASLGVLSAGIAHEINNPINFVYAGINSLLRDFQDIEPIIDEVSKLTPETENLPQKVEKIIKLKKENYFEEAFDAIPAIISDIKLGADRTAEIIKGLKNFSRIEKGELQQFDLREGIEVALLLLKNKYKNHIEIIRDFDENITEFLCYPGKINQVLLNIISNAIDAIEEKGTVTISTKKIDENILIRVKDDGIGMTDEVKERIFDPFFTTKPVGKGTGLGLSITYGIIQEHKGSIRIISKPGLGSEFLLTLPTNIK